MCACTWTWPISSCFSLSFMWWPRPRAYAHIMWQLSPLTRSIPPIYQCHDINILLINWAGMHAKRSQRLESTDFLFIVWVGGLRVAPVFGSKSRLIDNSWTIKFLSIYILYWDGPGIECQSVFDLETAVRSLKFIEWDRKFLNSLFFTMSGPIQMNLWAYTLSPFSHSHKYVRPLKWLINQALIEWPYICECERKDKDCSHIMVYAA